MNVGSSLYMYNMYLKASFHLTYYTYIDYLNRNLTLIKKKLLSYTKFLLKNKKHKSKERIFKEHGWEL